MSNSVRPHRRQPTRLPCPWNSPDKNTGVGCHFLLQCIKVKSESEVAQWCPTLSDPMDCSLPDSSIHGIFQARVLEWGAIAFSRSPIQLVKTRLGVDCGSDHDLLIAKFRLKLKKVEKIITEKVTCTPQCSLQHYLQQPGHGSDLNVHQQRKA